MTDFRLLDLRKGVHRYIANDGTVIFISCRIDLQNQIRLWRPTLALEQAFDMVETRPRGFQPRKLVFQVSADGIPADHRQFKYIPYNVDPSFSPFLPEFEIDGKFCRLFWHLPERRWHGYGL